MAVSVYKVPILKNTPMTMDRIILINHKKRILDLLDQAPEFGATKQEIKNTLHDSFFVLKKALDELLEEKKIICRKEKVNGNGLQMVFYKVQYIHLIS